MLSLSELRRAAQVLRDTRAGARVEKIVQTPEQELVLLLAGGVDRAPGDRCGLVLSFQPGVARVSQRAKLPTAPPKPLGLAQYLKAHLVGARLRDATIQNDDRQLRLSLDTRDAKWALLLSILGPRSNCYVLDAKGCVVHSGRPLGETRRDLSLGDPWIDPDGRPPNEGEDRFASVDDAKLLSAIEAHYAEAGAQADEDQLSRRIAQVLKKQRAAIDKKLGLVQKDLAAADEAPRFERLGELLKANLKRVRPGHDSLTAEDFETGEPVEIPLDPKLSAAKNLELLFRRARKAVKKGQKAAMELGATEERREQLESLARACEAADPEALRRLAEEPELSRLLAKYYPDAPKGGGGASKPARVWRIGKRELPTRLCPKVYRTADGLEIWVGKNDEGNDLLTTRLAKGRDLFFHLDGAPGSHVVLKVDPKQEPPHEAILDAAELSVNFSKAKNATKAAVHVAEIKDVSKPSGAKPGLVYVHRGRSIQLRRSPERLQRVLASREDD